MKKLLILFCLSLSLVQGQDSLMFDYAYRATDNIQKCYYKGLVTKISDSLYEVKGNYTKGKMTFCSHYSDSTLKTRHGEFTEVDSTSIWRFYFVNDLQHGPSKKYTVDEKLISKRTFANGFHVGVDSFFTSNGQLELTSDLNYRTYNGTIRQYKEGVVVRECPIKEGLFVCKDCGCDTLLKFKVSWGVVAKYDGVVEEDVQRNFHPNYSKLAPGKYEVWVRFTVSNKGEIMGIQIIKSSSSKVIDGEAIKTVSKLKRYKPAIQNGNPVAMEMQIPIVFIID